MGPHYTFRHCRDYLKARIEAAEVERFELAEFTASRPLSARVPHVHTTLDSADNWTRCPIYGHDGPFVKGLSEFS